MLPLLTRPLLTSKNINFANNVHKKKSTSLCKVCAVKNAENFSKVIYHLSVKNIVLYGKILFVHSVKKNIDQTVMNRVYTSVLF